MLNKSNALILGAIMGLSTLAFSGANASAAAMLPLQPIAAAQMADDGNVLLQDVRMGWDSRRDGRRCSSRRDNCRHYYQGFYYESPWWIVPGIVIQNDMNHHNGNRHIRWCKAHYPNYRARTNTWISMSGKVHRCNGPY